MLFGGMSLDSYCESVLYDIHIGKYKRVNKKKFRNSN